MSHRFRKMRLFFAISISTILLSYLSTPFCHAADNYSPEVFKEYLNKMMGRCNKSDDCDTHGFYDIDLVQISSKMFLTVGEENLVDGWQVCIMRLNIMPLL